MTREQAKILVEHGLTAEEVSKFYSSFDPKNFDIFKAFADGGEIEILSYENKWEEMETPAFSYGSEYRVKPKKRKRKNLTAGELVKILSDYPAKMKILVSTDGHEQAEAFFLWGEDNAITISAKE